MKKEQAVPKMLISMESAELWNVAGVPDQLGFESQPQ